MDEIVASGIVPALQTLTIAVQEQAPPSGRKYAAYVVVGPGGRHHPTRLMISIVTEDLTPQEMQMHEFGFPIERVRWALARSADKVEDAVALLLEQS
jgi:uncharacterized protein (DUF885 family)